jgi:hypothetical protein
VLRDAMALMRGGLTDLTAQAELESFKQLVAAKVPAAVCF